MAEVDGPLQWIRYGMESDIVKRLRIWQSGKWLKEYSLDDDIKEAADEIERLRRDLDKALRPEERAINDPDWGPCESSKQCHAYALACRNQGIEEAAQAAECHGFESEVGDDPLACQGCAEEVAANIRKLKDAKRFPLNFHRHTELCGFDRNASHSAQRYVCRCGWEGESPPQGDG